jgi:C-terminal processing protease CtpA/Prc
MIELFRTRYAFTDYKQLDWDAISAEFRPRFELAEANADAEAYHLALRDFTWSIPDGHVGGSFQSLNDLFLEETDGGIGMAIRELDDGRIVVNYVVADGPADAAGIELRAEILEIDGRPVDDVVSATVPWSSPFSTEHTRRLQQLRYATRFPVDTAVEITYQNAGDTEPTAVTLTAVAERESFEFSSFNAGLTGIELPLDFSVLDSGYGYVPIYSFFDNELLTIQLWERMMQTLRDNGVPGLVIDMRQNGGGNGFLADQMAAYFFKEPLSLGNTGFYDENLGEFYFDPATENAFIPPSEDLRYNGPITVIVGPNCNSACEFFSYDITLGDRATVVGQYPTAGLGGAIEVFAMPENESLQFTVGRGVDSKGQIHIEGKGVQPTVRVPVDEDTLFSDGDPVLDAAIADLDEATAVAVVDGGEIGIGEIVSGELAPGSRVQYTLAVSAGDDISIRVGDDTGGLDTYLRLYDSAGNLLAENDDEEAGTIVNSALEDLVVPDDMTLVVEVATYLDSGSGAYELEVVAN